MNCLPLNSDFPSRKLARKKLCYYYYIIIVSVFIFIINIHISINITDTTKLKPEMFNSTCNDMSALQLKYFRDFNVLNDADIFSDTDTH